MNTPDRKAVKLSPETAKLLGQAKAKILSGNPTHTSVTDDETIAEALSSFLAKK